MTESILDDLGREVTAILGPVTLCIALTVWIVRVLNPSGASNASAVGLATVFYSESVGKKLRRLLLLHKRCQS